MNCKLLFLGQSASEQPWANKHYLSAAFLSLLAQVNITQSKPRWSKYFKIQQELLAELLYSLRLSCSLFRLAGDEAEWEYSAQHEFLPSAFLPPHCALVTAWSAGLHRIVLIPCCPCPRPFGAGSCCGPRPRCEGGPAEPGGCVGSALTSAWLQQESSSSFLTLWTSAPAMVFHRARVLSRRWTLTKTNNNIWIFFLPVAECN